MTSNIGRTSLAYMKNCATEHKIFDIFKCVGLVLEPKSFESVIGDTQVRLSIGKLEVAATEEHLRVIANNYQRVNVFHGTRCLLPETFECCFHTLLSPSLWSTVTQSSGISLKEKILQQKSSSLVAYCKKLCLLHTFATSIRSIA